MRALRLTVGLGLAGMLMVAQSAALLAVPPQPGDGEVAEAEGIAEQYGTNVARLIDDLARKEAELAGLDAEIATLRGEANKALVDLERAQNEAARTENDAHSARAQLEASSTAIREAQERYDAFVRYNYMEGAPADSLELFAGATSPGDVLDRAHLRKVVGVSQRSAMEALERARAEFANQDSRARFARDQARAAASAAQNAREAAINAFHSALDRQQGAMADRARLERERAAAQSLLQAARDAVDGLRSQRVQQHERAEVSQPAHDSTTAEGTSAPAELRTQEDVQAQVTAPEQQGNAHSQPPVDTGSSETLRQPANLLADLDLGALVDTLLASGSMGSLDMIAPPQTAPPHTNPPTTPPGSQQPPPSGTDPIPSTREQKVETVVGRALSQVGVPYAWGGGNHLGPTLGIRDGGVADRHGDYLKVGFDCSGLMMYAFAGVGILLPHFSGYIYNMGTKVPVAQMQRGDMLFWGANGSQHVALYIGDGQMVEAPFSGATVRVTPVRWGGIQPHAVRMF